VIDLLIKSNVQSIITIVEAVKQAAKCLVAEGLSANCIAIIIRVIIFDIFLFLLSNSLAFYTVVVNLSMAIKECLLRKFLLVPQ